MTKENNKCAAPPSAPAAAVAFGLLCMNDWAGYHERPIVIVGETPTRFRVRLPDSATSGIKLPKRRYLYPGEVTLVPKSAVRRTQEGKATNG